ncbi:MAG: lipocalin-like domain-containing protein [Gammaproteobacteria bacterium]|nr:lipocalin-like domain-containing protein [Gammaproteobacteria bacterium]MDH5692083.1 lipocalin-like domain-containing protein [Gammaproteobacteria bacterium]
MNSDFKQIPTQDHALLGAWRLRAFYIESAQGQRSYPFGESPQGLLVYTDTGMMSAQLMRDNRPMVESGDHQVATQQEMEENFRGCVSYFGSYELHVESGFVLHHVEKSLFPNWEGVAQKRFFELTGDQLRITTPPTTWGGTENTAVLLWERVK